MTINWLIVAESPGDLILLFLSFYELILGPHTTSFFLYYIIIEKNKLTICE